MAKSSWVLKSGLAAPYLKSTAQDWIFIRPSPWVFGRGRQYSVTEAQVAQLATVIGRAYVLMLILLIVVPLVVSIAAPEALALHPIPSVLALAVLTVLLVAVLNAYIARAADSLLADVAWTSAPREPYNPAHNLRKSLALTSTFLAAWPTWALVVFVIVGLVAVPGSAIKAYEALSSGRVTFDLLSAAIVTWLWVESIAALIKKFRAGPSRD